MVNRVVEREPTDSRRDYYIEEPKDNFRKVNIDQNKNYRKINIQHQPKPTIENANDYGSNLGIRKYYSSNINQNQTQQNIYQKKDYFDSYQPRRINTPDIQRPNNLSYSRQGNRIIETNYSRNNRSNISYNEEYPYKMLTEQNGYIITKTETNSPKYRTPYLGYSPNVNNKGKNIYVYQNQERPRQREYISNTELGNQRGFEYEFEYGNDQDDDVYEVPGSVAEVYRFLLYPEERDCQTGGEGFHVGEYGAWYRHGVFLEGGHQQTL